MLRHIVATLAYRGGKAVRGAPPEFATYRASPKTRTPDEILAHIGDLLDWGVALANGSREWHNSTPLEWDQEVSRFFAALELFDRRLASNEPLRCTEEKLFQGPVADALTHVGQIAMLRRLAGCPIRGENYYRAEIVEGRVGAEQAKAAMEFD